MFSVGWRANVDFQRYIFYPWYKISDKKLDEEMDESYQGFVNFNHDKKIILNEKPHK